MKETAKILVDLDSLLDIRQAILSNLLNIEDLTNLINSEEYNFRDTDIFPNIDKDKYDEINNNRTDNLLPRSTISYILNILKTKIVNLEKRNTFYGETKTPEIILNIYPYNLTKEQIEHIQNLLFIKLDSKCLVNVINKSIEELTPYFIKSSDIITCFIYDFTIWLEKHTDALSAVKLPDTLFYFPSIYKIKYDKKQLEEINKLGFKDLFSYVEYLYSSVANISFLPIVFYSNIITASILIEKYNDVLKNTKLGDNDGDSSTEI